MPPTSLNWRRHKNSACERDLAGWSRHVGLLQRRYCVGFVGRTFAARFYASAALTVMRCLSVRLSVRP